MLKILAGALFALSALPASNPAWAWGDQAHATICAIAFAELGDSARKEVARLIAGDGEYTSFAEACTGPDHPRQRDAEDTIDLPRSAAAHPAAILADGKCPDEKPCLLGAIDKDLAILKDRKAADADRLAALKFLGHWVGDIHQPLHVRFADDNGGSAIAIDSHLCRGSLHSVWETCIFVESYGSDPARSAESFRREITAADRAAWDASSPADWARESFAIGISPPVQYCVMNADGACWYAADREEWKPGSKKRKVEVGSEYIATHAATVKERVKRAGVRLARLLNEALGQ
jgi:hypothetical protein